MVMVITLTIFSFRIKLDLKTNYYLLFPTSEGCLRMIRIIKSLYSLQKFLNISNSVLIVDKLIWLGLIAFASIFAISIR